MKSRSGIYRRRDGEERIWYEPGDIELMMEDELRKSGLFPPEERPIVDIERFVGSLGVRMDQYAELDSDVLGLTEFYSGAPPKIFINSDLTGAFDDDNTLPGIRGRWRITVAHEACHVVMHRILFELNASQEHLFQTSDDGPKKLMRCLKKSVLLRGGTSDWREVQANMGMAALLMPQSLFRDVARKVASRLCISPAALTSNSVPAAKLAAELATLFDVSKQAAGIRLETLHIVSRAGQPWLIAGSQD